MDTELTEFVEQTVTQFAIPGVAVGIFHGGRDRYICHGLTSVDNPLPVDQDTLFGIGSVSKTFTATALLCLVRDGMVELDAPLRLYVPEVRLADERAASQIKLLNLLNHSAGLDWGLQLDTGEGDEALAAYVAHMAEVAAIAPPGQRASYSQAGYNLIGRVIEKVTGQVFEDAIAALLLEPLGLNHSFYRHEEVMTRRFCVAHNRAEDGSLSALRLRRRPRGDNPGGGLASSVSDQLRWARFHLGDGRAENGTRILPPELLDRMKKPTIALRGSNLGDAIGMGWFLRTIDGVQLVGHAGSTNGQFAELLLVPEREFAVVALSNAGPDGIRFNQAIVEWALDNCLGLIDRNPAPLPFHAAHAAEIVGKYENDVMTLTVGTDGPRLRLEVLLKPEARAAYKEAPPDHDPFEFGLLPGDRDEYIITSGAFNGQRGFFTRDEEGEIAGVDLAGRLFTRVAFH